MGYGMKGKIPGVTERQQTIKKIFVEQRGAQAVSSKLENHEKIKRLLILLYQKMGTDTSESHFDSVETRTKNWPRCKGACALYTAAYRFLARRRFYAIQNINRIHLHRFY
jgi:hypothetical protein